MKSRFRLAVASLTMGWVVAGAEVGMAQNVLPSGVEGVEMLRNLRPSGMPVVPLFDGWYQKQDGSYDLCFGYANLNLDEVLNIPIGPDNAIEPAQFNGIQPTHFDVVPYNGDKRYLCVFTVNIPADFGEQHVVWSLRVDGQAYTVPGHIASPFYRLEEPFLPSRNVGAPIVKLVDPAGSEGIGRGGDVRAGPVSAKVGTPLRLAIEVRPSVEGESDLVPDDPDPGQGFGRGGGGPGAEWAVHQGSGKVTFTPPVVEGTTVTTMASFEEPGDYVLRFQSPGTNTFFCCWTNGFVEVTVTR